MICLFAIFTFGAYLAFSFTFLCFSSVEHVYFAFRFHQVKNTKDNFQNKYTYLKYQVHEFCLQIKFN